VAFSADGQRIVSGSMDETVKVWETAALTALQLQSRVASALVAGLFEAPLLKNEVIDRLRRDPKLDDSLRRLALQIAAESTDSPNLLNDTSWLVARRRGLTLDDYLRALRYAEAACRLAPDEPAFRTTLALACYRAGHYQGALALLSRTPPAAVVASDGQVPAELAVTAMAQQQLGQAEDARRSLARLRDLVTRPPWNTDAESKALLDEAVALVESVTTRSKAN
jgi:hypothetical protein